jgi:tellurite resistance protein TerC
MDNLTNIWIWLGFSLFLVIALSIDFLVLGEKHARAQDSMWAILYWTLGWVVLALLFNSALWLYLNYSASPAFANQKALEFLTGYLIEKSLSIDNLFVFYMVFQQFHIPIAYQQRIFAYGIWGAIIMRLLLILLGTWLVHRFHWLLYIMGAFLLLTGIKMLFFKEQEKDVTENLFVQLLKKFLRVTNEIKDNHFFVRKKGLLYVTPLFIALLLIEFSDLIFAFDSIPAIFAITTDPFIVWSSNIFAILGLRALYFLLAGLIGRFHLLKYGIALILVFVGLKMVIEPWLQIPVLISLGAIISILMLFAWLSSRRLKCTLSKH